MRHNNRLIFGRKMRGTVIFLIIMGVLVLFSGANAEEVTKTVRIKLFYPALGSQNSTNDPNWFYFWTEALSYSGQFTYDGSLSTSETTVYSATSWTIKIAPNAYWPGQSGNDPTGNRYINGFKATVLHESWHRDHRVHNYSVHGHHGSSADPLSLSDDPDQDGICNQWESQIGTNPNVPNSTEDGANWAESHGTYGHQNIDWAYPGSQRE